MKTKLLLVALLAAGTGHAGPAVSVRIGGCAPPPVVISTFCGPQVSWRWYGPVAFSPWGPYVVSSDASSFRTVSSLFQYPADTPVYRVPDPIPLAQPIVIPSTTFRWKN